MKTEIFDKIVNLVAETTELKKECILSSCKTEDLVAARCLFVHFCAASGIPTISIAEYFNSISHELRHLCDDIASVHDIPTNGEEIAYLTGDVAMEMKDVLSVLICDCQCCKMKRYKKIR